MTTTTATVTATTVTCPGMCGGKCGGESVAVLTSAKAKTVRFAACSHLRAQGWKGPQVAVAKADAHRYGA